MTEWTVVTVIVVLVGLVGTIIGATWKLCAKITENTEALKSVRGSLEALDQSNSKSHDRIWCELNEHTDQIGDHETRITVIEKRGG